ncbi:MAG: DUF1730 domain-containing protein [Clostridia bacterium]|nr:DUF1730 domain-containing protein [Clostridia bacterium]
MKEILDRASPLWGICPFVKIKDNLIECRAKSRLPVNSRSVIITAFPYLLDEKYYKDSNISKYSVPADYHPIITARLDKAAGELREKYPGYEFEVFADNSPIPEVRAASIAGIGVIGSNSLLITERYGSFVFLGEIVTDMPLAAGNGEIKECIKCGRCTAACPGSAIINGKIDREKCLSHITQKKGFLTEEEKYMIRSSGCIWGCDICQNVCPLNSGADLTQIKEFEETAKNRADADTPIEGRAYAWRGEKVIRRNLELQKEKE